MCTKEYVNKITHNKLLVPIKEKSNENKRTINMLCH